MTDIVVEIRKGLVSGIYSDVKDARFVVVDWDLVERFEADDEGRVATEFGHEALSALPPASAWEYNRAIE
jgi:hypothetical protein